MIINIKAQYRSKDSLKIGNPARDGKIRESRSGLGSGRAGRRLRYNT